jgi:hypothetical protein
VARAAGRARSQRFRVTSALKKGPRAASAGRADTSRRSETSGASCWTSQEPAVPRDECEQKRISHQERRRGARARGESQTLGGARYERREGVPGQPNAAGRLTQKLPSLALKEVERLGPTIQAI